MKKIKLASKGKLMQIGLKNYRKLDSYNEDLRFLEMNNKDNTGQIISENNKDIKIMQILIYLFKNVKFLKQKAKKFKVL